MPMVSPPVCSLLRFVLTSSQYSSWVLKASVSKGIKGIHSLLVIKSLSRYGIPKCEPSFGFELSAYISRRKITAPSLVFRDCIFFLKGHLGFYLNSDD